MPTPTSASAFDAMVAAAYERGGAINMAAYGEIDDVIDLANTRRWIAMLFDPGQPPKREGKRRPHVATW